MLGVMMLTDDKLDGAYELCLQLLLKLELNFTFLFLCLSLVV